MCMCTCGLVKRGEDGERDIQTKGPMPLVEDKLTCPFHRVERLKSARGELKGEQQGCFTM